MKRALALGLAVLQVAWSFGPAATEAVAAPVARAQVRVQPGSNAAPIVIVPLGGFGVAPLTSTLQGPGALANLPVLSAPAVSPRVEVSASVLSAPSAPGAAAQAVSAEVSAKSVPLSVLSPAAQAQAQAENAASASASLSQAAEFKADAPQAPGETSRGSAEASFAKLHGQRLIQGSGEVSGVSAVKASGGRVRSFLSRFSPSSSLKSRPEPAAPGAPGGPGGPSTLKKVLTRAGVAVGALAAIAGATALVPHAAIVGAIGSIVLSVIGLPQIYKNFKNPQGVKDLVLASPLMWFAAATLLSVVSIGNGASMAWNVANLAGVAESAIVIGQINAQKKDKKDLKATLLTAAAVLAPIPLIALQVFMPLKAWVDLAFTAAMGLLWVLNWPQIRQNYKLFEKEGRAPQGIAPAYPALVAGGSLLHLFTALTLGDTRWMMNAIIAIVTAGTVLAQIYSPKAANAMVGPLVKLQDKVMGLINKARGKQDAGRDGSARAQVDEAFGGADLSGFAAKDSDAQVADMVARAKALPGRSVIFLEAPTAAGKSTLAKSLEGAMGSRIASLEVDRYFKSKAQIPVKAGTPDYDRPDALHLDRVAKDIKTLLAGGRIELPAHDMVTGETRFDSGEFMQLGPDEVLIVDSIFASHPLLRDAAQGKASLNVYLDAPAVVRLVRRLARDKVARGRPVIDNLQGWSRILENEAAYITPMKADADLVINLIKAEELEGLREAYAKLLLEEQAAGRGAEASKLMAEMIKASLAADAVPAGR